MCHHRRGFVLLCTSIESFSSVHIYVFCWLLICVGRCCDMVHFSHCGVCHSVAEYNSEIYLWLWLNHHCFWDYEMFLATFKSCAVWLLLRYLFLTILLSSFPLIICFCGTSGFLLQISTVFKGTSYENVNLIVVYSSPLLNQYPSGRYVLKMFYFTVLTWNMSRDPEVRLDCSLVPVYNSWTSTQLLSFMKFGQKMFGCTLCMLEHLMQYYVGDNICV